MKYIVTINNNSYEVEVEQGEARLIKTDEVAAIPVVAKTIKTVHVDSEKPAAMASMEESNSEPKHSLKILAGEEITAPMPGTILSIKKKNGDQVKKGDVIFVLEAMKMENEILAPVDCVIGQITTAKGACVNTGDVLAVLH